MTGSRRAQIGFVAAVAAHGSVGAGLASLDRAEPRRKSEVVELEVAASAAPQVPLAPAPPPPEPEPVMKAAAAVAPVRPLGRVPKLASVTAKPRVAPQAAGGTTSGVQVQGQGEPEPYRMPGLNGTMPLPKSGAGGSPAGQPGANGTGGEGGPGGQRIHAAASLKRMPQPVGDDYDYVRSADYPMEARRLKIEGPVRVEIVVSAEGRVEEAKIVTGLGHGLDEMALKLIRKIRFRPAVDTYDRPVPTRIVWTFNFQLPP